MIQNQERGVTKGAPRNFQRGGSDKISRQKWPILLLLSKFDCCYWFELEWMLSIDRSLTMSLSAISNIAFTSKREGFRPPKLLLWLCPWKWRNKTSRLPVDKFTDNSSKKPPIWKLSSTLLCSQGRIQHVTGTKLLPSWLWVCPSYRQPISAFYFSYRFFTWVIRQLVFWKARCFITYSVLASLRIGDTITQCIVRWCTI